MSARSSMSFPRISRLVALGVRADGQKVLLAINALAVSIHLTEFELRVGVPLLGGLAVPDQGLRVVLRHALAVSIHPAEAGLRVGVPLLGGLAAPEERLRVPLLGGLTIPRDGLRVVLWNAPAGGVHRAEIGLCGDIPLLGDLAVPEERLRVVLRHAPAGGASYRD